MPAWERESYSQIRFPYFEHKNYSILKSIDFSFLFDLALFDCYLALLLLLFVLAGW